MSKELTVYNVEVLKPSGDILSYVTRRINELENAKNKSALIELLRLQAFIECRMTPVEKVTISRSISKFPIFGCPHCLAEFNKSVPVIVSHNEAVVYCPQCQERVSFKIGGAL